MRIYLHARSAVCKFYGDDVEAARLVNEPPSGEKIEGHFRQSPLFPTSNRCGRAAKLPARPRLHLDEDDDAAVARNDVDFAEPAAVSARKNCVPPALQLAAGEIFADFSE